MYREGDPPQDSGKRRGIASGSGSGRRGRESPSSTTSHREETLQRPLQGRGGDLEEVRRLHCLKGHEREGMLEGKPSGSLHPVRDATRTHRGRRQKQEKSGESGGGHKRKRKFEFVRFHSRLSFVSVLSPSGARRIREPVLPTTPTATPLLRPPPQPPPNHACASPSPTH